MCVVNENRHVKRDEWMGLSVDFFAIKDKQIILIFINIYISIKCRISSEKREICLLSETYPYIIANYQSFIHRKNIFDIYT